MYSLKWFMSIVTLLVVDVRTGALQQKDIEPRRCYLCYASNSTTCEQPVGTSMVVCPTERPYCATVAASPDFTSSLTCAATTERPCSLMYSLKQTYELTCVCTAHLCNAPFSRELQNEILNFSSANIAKNNTDLTDVFLNSFISNVTDASVYRLLTVEVTEKETEMLLKNFSQSTMRGTIVTPAKTDVPIRRPEEINAPRAEALKHEATVPSDDDEDESEGSGSYEESRSQRRPASAPAAPSSYLPANENKASPLFFNLLSTTPLFLYIIV